MCNQFSQEILTIVYQLALDKYKLSEATKNDDFETINSPYTKDNSYSPTLSTSSSSYKCTDVYDPYTIIDESTVIQRQACEFVIQWYVVGLDNDYVPVINGDVVESWNIIEKILTDEVKLYMHLYMYMCICIHMYMYPHADLYKNLPIFSNNYYSHTLIFRACFFFI